MARIVLSDTSPLIGLSRVKGVGWLREFFQTVELTQDVFDELAPTEADLREGLDSGWIRLHPITESLEPRPAHLGLGEWSTITAAERWSGRTLILMDDRLARREAASRGLPVTGTAAIIGLAQRRGLISSARDVFEGLFQSDFRISAQVIRAVLNDLDSDRK